MIEDGRLLPCVKKDSEVLFEPSDEERSEQSEMPVLCIIHASVIIEPATPISDLGERR